MRILSVHAHFDDYEFVGGGLFEKWRKRDPNLKAKVIVCTNGEAGHHFRSRKETGDLRRKEQLASAAIGKYEIEFLKYPNGEYPREGCLQVSPDFLAALWKSIRDFKPDYLFCPPLTSITSAGVHIDHIAVADGVRKVAYMINVPHCFSPEYKTENEVSEFINLPVIINYSDYYMKDANDLDFAIDISEEFETKMKMVWCHQSQVVEWLPWVTGMPKEDIPKSLQQYSEQYRVNCVKRNQKFGIQNKGMYEFFSVTAWGRIPTFDQLMTDLPEIDQNAISINALRKKLNTWNS